MGHSGGQEAFPFRENLNYFIVEVMCNLYFYYEETIAHKPVYIEKNLKACHRFYDSTYSKIADMVTPEILSANYNLALQNYVNSGRCNGMLCQHSIQQFLEMMKSDEGKKECVEEVKESSGEE